MNNILINKFILFFGFPINPRPSFYPPPLLEGKISSKSNFLFKNTTLFYLKFLVCLILIWSMTDRIKLTALFIYLFDICALRIWNKLSLSKTLLIIIMIIISKVFGPYVRTFQMFLTLRENPMFPVLLNHGRRTVYK